MPVTFFSPSQVTHITGIKAHTLRVWERRYDFMVADRKSSGARVYSEKEVKTLLNVKILIESGLRISKIVKLTEQEVFIAVEKIYTLDTIDDEIYVQTLIQCMLEFDEERFNEVFSKLMQNRGLVKSMSTVFYPFLRRIGGLWLNEKIIPVNEHFISNLIRQKIISAIDQLDLPLDGARKICLFLPETEVHEIGLLMAYYICKKAGWQVLYFGIRVPIEDLGDALKKQDCKYAFCLMQITSEVLAKQLMQLLEENDSLSLLLAGNPLFLEDLVKHARCTYLHKLEELQQAIVL